MRHTRLPLVVAFWGGIGFAQNPPPPPVAENAPPAQAEMSAHDSPATFSSRVFLVQVPVVVRDKQGHAIGTLKKEDFQLFDKGKPQIITRFAVEKAGIASIPAVQAIDAALPGGAEGDALPIPEHFIAYLFDDVHLDPGDIARMRVAAIQHVDWMLDAYTRVAIVTTSGIGQLDFTDDIVKIHDALNRIQPNMRTPNSSGDCPHLTLYMADLIVNQQDPTAIAVASADAASCTQSLTTAGAAAYQQMVMSSAISELNTGETETNRAMEVLRALVLRMTGTPGSRNIVLISPGFLLPGDDLRPAEEELLDKAIRANVTINTLDATGVYTMTPGGDASSRGTVNTTNQGAISGYAQAARLAQQDILEELASGTGGSFFHNDNGFKEGLDQITKQPDFVYVLGFSPGDMKYDGNLHSLKVVVQKPAGLSLQSRHAYYAPKRPKDPEEAAKEDIREAIFSRDEIQDIPVDLKLQFFKSTPANARINVISVVNVKNLRFRKDADRSKNTLTLVAGLFDRNGNFVSGLQRTVDMNLRAPTLTALDATGLTVRTTFDVTPGSYTVRVVVRDAEGQQMAARNGVVQVP
jgi:VWFA-related protein